MKSEFNYIPNPKNAPCFKGHVCKNHDGKCRNTCEDFKAYTNIKQEASDKRLTNNQSYEYSRTNMAKQERRLRWS